MLSCIWPPVACNTSNFNHREPLAKYGVRHYAHFTCGLNKWGADFLNRIPLHEIGNLPFRLVDEYQLRQAARFVEYVRKAEEA